MNSIYPWQHEQWTVLRTRVSTARLAHGLLFLGPAGTGKLDFAIAFAQSLLCSQPTADGHACGRCGACQLLQAGTHPDFLQITPPEDKTQIVIDQIRELSRAFTLKSHAGGYKVAVLSPAEHMNTAAANSLLKTLEEPTDNTVLILITDQPARLPATVRSRCQHIRFPSPPLAVGLTWLTSQLGSTAQGPELLLRLADGAPIRALTLGQGDALKQRQVWLDQLLKLYRGQTDPLRIAAEWAEDAELSPLYWFASCLADLLRLRYGGPSAIKNTDFLAELQTLAALLTTVDLHSILTRVWQDYRLAQQTTVNRPLLMEGLVIEWVRCGQNRRKSA